MRRSKLILLTVISVILMFIFVTGCEQSQTPAPSPSPSQGNPIPDTDRLDEVYEAIKQAYGEDYYPSAEIEKEQLEEIYGIKAEYIKNFIAEGPFFSLSVDLFIGIKAEEGKADDVENALIAYQDYLINDSFQYGMNIAKVNASQIVRVGDHIFFLMLGKSNNDPDATEEEMFEFALEQVQIGVDAINGVFN